jgi:hypothetical protein
MPIYQEKLMRGNTTMRNFIGDYLSVAVPQYIDIMRSQNAELNEFTLPYPKAYLETDPMQVLEYPSIGVYCTGSDDFVQTDTKPSGALEFDATYEVTIFVATKTAFLGQDEAGIPVYEKDYRYSAMRQRDDLLSCVKAAILNTPSLGTAGQEYRAYANRDTLRDASPEPVKLHDNRNGFYICSGIINVNVKQTESTVVPIIGHANLFSVESSLITSE